MSEQRGTPRERREPEERDRDRAEGSRENVDDQPGMEGGADLGEERGTTTRDGERHPRR